MLLVTAFCGLLISPVTWTHHWVWALPLCILLGYRIHRASAAAGVMLLVVLVTFSIDFRLFVPAGNRLELTWGTLETLVGNAYLLTAGFVGAAGVLILARARHTPGSAGLSRIPSQRRGDLPDRQGAGPPPL